MAALTKLVDGALDPALGVQRGLGRPDIESDAQAGKTGLDPLSDLCRRPPADVVRGVRGGSRASRPNLLRDAPRQVLDVGAVVAVLRDRLAPPDRNDARAQVPD